MPTETPQPTPLFPATDFTLLRRVTFGTNTKLEFSHNLCGRSFQTWLSNGKVPRRCPMCFAEWKQGLQAEALNAKHVEGLASAAQSPEAFRSRLPGAAFPGRKPKTLKFFYQLFSRGRLIPFTTKPTVGDGDVLFVSRNGGEFEQEGYVDSNAIRIAMEREVSRPLPYAEKKQHLTVPELTVPFFTMRGTMHGSTEVQAELLYQKRVLIFKKGYIPVFYPGVDWVEDGNHMRHLYLVDDSAPVRLLNPEESEEDFDFMEARIKEIASKGSEAPSEVALPEELPTESKPRGRPSWASLDPLPEASGSSLPLPDLGDSASEPVYGDD